MSVYRVSIWASVEVEAENEEEACNMARDIVINGEIKNRDYDFTAEETDHEAPYC